MKSETPRTDALIKRSENDLLAITSYKRAVTLSRKLELELNAEIFGNKKLMRENDGLRAALAAMPNDKNGATSSPILH